MNLSGKTVFMISAGQGSGRAIAERFVQEGANVTATDINLPLLSDLPDANTFAWDVTNKSELQSSIKEIDPDILVNCAGFVHHGTLMDASDENSFTTGQAYIIDGGWANGS